MVQLVKSIHQYFGFFFFRNRVVDIAILEQELVSNERSGHFTFYKGIQEFFKSLYICSNNGFLKFNALGVLVAIWQKILWNYNNSPNAVTNCHTQNFMWNGNYVQHTIFKNIRYFVINTLIWKFVNIPKECRITNTFIPALKSRYWQPIFEKTKIVVSIFKFTYIVLNIVRP